jgi:hypothetical protein
VEFVVADHRLKGGVFRFDNGFFNAPPPFQGTVSQDRGLFVEFRVLRARNVSFTVGKFHKQFAELPFRFGQIVELLVPLDKPYVFPQAREQYSQALIDKIKVIQGLCEENIPVGIQYQEILDHSDADVKDKDIVFKIHAFVHTSLIGTLVFETQGVALFEPRQGAY